ncbi:N(6)-L-threonylcarbamoyladenine synthase [Malassezia cuniculi]|uniref:N(6)-L-threonylcarbamoyladenine synthase n=1 Tax=Malassezia cuniculi TaxID=948313 RepID=A0AAF0ET59_9BASI|nr:N(6)-L-threonylcarbamoyladenine synthase [Malassezia cuniculi]
MRDQIPQKGFDRHWTHPVEPQPGFAHNVTAPAIDLEAVIAGDENAVVPLPDTTPICARCRRALYVVGNGGRRIWALPCGHVIDGYCVAQLSSRPLDDPDKPAHVFQCPVADCTQRCHPEPGHRHSTARPRLILGIESSCDDSCAAVVSETRDILSNVVIRQDHSATSGIHPLLAARGHQGSVPIAIAQALREARVSIADIDGIAVTQGPGMPSSLVIGMTAAKTLAATAQKPLIYIHHMQAHALTCLLTEPDPPAFPFLTLLISGGHTMAVLAHSLERFEVLANTADDSVGNTFDKFARELGLPWQSASGALVERLASEATVESQVTLPRIMLGQPSFSYAGLKSSAARAVATCGGPSMDIEQKRALAREFQRAAFAPLEDKVVRCVSPRAARGKLSRGWFLADSESAPATPVTSVVSS